MSLKETVGPQPLHLPLLYPGHEVNSFALSYTPTRMCHHRSRAVKSICQGLNSPKLWTKLNLFYLWTNKKTAECRWFTPIIPATQEAEIRRIVIWSQPRQTVYETLSWKNSTQPKKGWQREAQVVECLLSKCEVLNSNPILPMPPPPHTHTGTMHLFTSTSSIFNFFFFLVGLGFELKASCLQRLFQFLKVHSMAKIFEPAPPPEKHICFRDKTCKSNQILLLFKDM
jgi:hypothetical protein